MVIFYIYLLGIHTLICMVNNKIINTVYTKIMLLKRGYMITIKAFFYEEIKKKCQNGRYINTSTYVKRHYLIQILEG